MIQGHGDDIYQYTGIRTNFSSNIYAHQSHQALMDFLAAQPQLIDYYPEPEAWSLERLIAERLSIEPANVIVTSGATEAIYLVAQTFPLRAVIPTPTFSEYADACRMFGREEGGESTMLWLCNPNNPTGEVYDQTYIDRMMAEHQLVVLDQSYEHYTPQHVMSAQEGCRTARCVQIHSMTKTYGVPGLRLGFITAHEQLTARIREKLRPWTVSPLAIEAGKYLLAHDELICLPDFDEAQRLRQRLQEIEGVEVMPTQTNFMLCRLTCGTAAALKDYLARRHGILIRDASNFEGLTPQHFRIAAQRPEENDALVEGMKGMTNDK